MSDGRNNHGERNTSVIDTQQVQVAEFIGRLRAVGAGNIPAIGLLGAYGSGIEIVTPSSARSVEADINRRVFFDTAHRIDPRVPTREDLEG